LNGGNASRLAVAEEQPSMFTWIPIYTELAEKLLAYRDRQKELLGMIDDLKNEGLQPVGTKDKDKNNKPTVITQIDPFTFFANFNHSNHKEDKRRQMLDRLQAKFNLASKLPEDFDGVPVVPPFTARFFPWSYERQVDDIPSLWALAKSTVSAPPEKLDPKLFLRCLNIKAVGSAKLTMGMFWMNPRHYLALDKNNRKLFEKHDITTKVNDLPSYLKLIAEVNEKLGTDYPKISRTAWEQSNVPPPRKQYWAGGAYWDGTSKVAEFTQGNFWQIGWDKEETKPAAKQTWDRFEQVNVGDEFAIKGLGGQYDLVIYYVGEVLEKTDEGILRLSRIERPLYKGKAPSGPPWFDTLVPVTSQPAIDLIFHGKKPQETGSKPSAHTDSSPPVTNLILYGPPGTGKTYQTIERSVKIIEPAFLGDHAAYKQRFDQLMREQRIAFITFHQSYSYEDFVEGIRPVLDQKGTEPRYECRAGIFKQLAVNALVDCLERVGTDQTTEGTYTDQQKAEIVQGFLTQGKNGVHRLKPESTWKPFVLIVDEINRGNISKILGELITLIEGDKRIRTRDNQNSLIVTLPYSGHKFAVPANLFLLATMNTADKSIALVDVALRRRFDFEELPVDLQVCKELTDRMRSALKELNQRIALRKDRDHRIGHAYFLNVGDDNTFNHTFRQQIIPLLQEYFYNDWDGLRYILGDNSKPDGSFICKTPNAAAPEVRTKWQWFFDAGTDDLNCLQTLCNNYGIA
jgi:hypothetical protein